MSALQLSSFTTSSSDQLASLTAQHTELVSTVESQRQELDEVKQRLHELEQSLEDVEVDDTPTRTDLPSSWTTADDCKFNDDGGEDEDDGDSEYEGVDVEEGEEEEEEEEDVLEDEKAVRPKRHFELVLIPFIGTFKHLWSSRTGHNIRPGPKKLWTRVNSNAVWLDPMIPNDYEAIELKKSGLIQRHIVDAEYVQDGRDLLCGHRGHPGFISAFKFALGELTNVEADEGINELYRAQFPDENANPLPEWAEGLATALIPLRFPRGVDDVLEYQLRPEVREREWTYEDLRNTNAIQDVYDESTKEVVHRVYLTTIEGYLGLQNVDLGQGDWGMGSD